jgi:hypothetical protein
LQGNYTLGNNDFTYSFAHRSDLTHTIHSMVERSGEICLIREILENKSSIGMFVRVTGHVQKLRDEEGMLEITHDGVSLFVDTNTHIDIKDSKEDDLVQFIGEIKKTSTQMCQRYGNIFLEAKIFRIVNGLDMKLYEEALKARRNFLQTIS